MPKRGKKYLEAAEKIDGDNLYEPREAIELTKETSISKFDGTVEVHIRLGVDTRHADQLVRETVMLPHGLGKTVRVLVFAEGDAARSAKEAGADYIADDEIISKIQGGWLEFDATVAALDMMREVGKLGKVLGPRGLMPSPKAGTVVAGEDLPRVINELKSGRVEFRADKTANIHVPIGKASFAPEKLYENLAALMEVVKKARPAAAKGTYIRKVTLTTTMGPGIRVDPVEAQAMVD
jgi:large subunit ribosomal protein L1